MRRIVVVGPSGAGKTRFALELAGIHDVRHIELDAIHHQPGWTQLSLDEFRRRVESAIATDDWVADGNYSNARDLVWARADTVIILDYPRHLVMRRLLGRTLKRVITRQRLWHGNQETWRNLVSRDPEENILLWSWTAHQKLRDRYTNALEDEAFSHVQFFRFNSPRSARRMLRELRAEP